VLISEFATSICCDAVWPERNAVLEKLMARTASNLISQADIWLSEAAKLGTPAQVQAMLNQLTEGLTAVLALT
jgi:hypothetical protein